VAVNCCDVPVAIDALLGEIWMDCRTTCPLPPVVAGDDELDTPPQLTRVSKPNTNRKQRIQAPQEIRNYI
jgi:hypothetical protein